MGFGKKLTALVLAAAMTAAACSCGTESGKSTAGEESSQAEEKPDFRTEMRDDMTTGDIVAEKRMVCRSCGTSFRIVSISSRKPMLSISSASSRIIMCRLSSFSVPRRIWSITRPGVPTTICALPRRAVNWRSIGWPP